jgi:hypothetical protein
MRMCRRQAILRGLVALWLALPAASGAAGQARTRATASGTQVTHYEPWSGSVLAPGFRAAHKRSGRCFATAIASNRADAYRCFTGNLIHDPCFAPAAPPPRTVACPDGTAGSRLVVLIHLTGPPPAPLSGRPRSYFEVELRGGTICNPLTGTVPKIGSRFANWTCRGGHVLSGRPRWEQGSLRVWAGDGVAGAAPGWKRVALARAWW